MWDPVLDRLALERDVIAVDMPGLRRLTAARRAATPAALAAAIDAELGIERPHVAGNSLGGWVALELAVAGRARSVTAIAPAGLWPQPLAPRRSQARRFARALRPVLPALLRSSAAAAPHSAPRSRTPSACRTSRRWPRARVRGRARLRGHQRGYAREPLQRVDELRVPVTLAWPDHDGSSRARVDPG